MEEKISIIVPIYNVPEIFLKKCVDSLIHQTYGNIEIILVDDGSDEKCAKMCDEFLKIDKRIIVIHQVNKGLSATRNVGVNKASGKWIMFVDGDDYLSENLCMELENINNKFPNLDVICCGYNRDMGKKIIECKLNEIQEGLYLDEENKYLQRKVLDFNAHFSSATCKLIRRKFLIDCGIYHDESLKYGVEGIEFNNRLWKRVRKAYVLNKYMYFYVCNNKSITNVYNEENYRFVLEGFNKIKNQINDESDEFREALISDFYRRIVFVIITVAISGYFSPMNKEKYEFKKNKYMKYLENDLIKETLKRYDKKQFDIFRNIIIYCIKHKFFFAIKIISNVRYFQKIR